MRIEARSESDLRRYTGYLLRRAFLKAGIAAKQCLPGDTHVREAVVLAVLDNRGPLSQKALGDVIHLNRSLVVKLIDVLEDKRWVSRERDPDDRRIHALQLTPAGRAALAVVDQDLDRGEAALTAALEPAESDRLKELLRLLLPGDVLAAGPMADRAGYLITHAHYRMRGWAEDAMRDLDLHPRDFGVLNTLDAREPCSQVAIAESLGITPPAVLGFLDELETRGLVTRERRDGDRRVYDVKMTTKGRTILHQARRAGSGVQAQVVDLLGTDADVELRSLLSRLVD